MDFENIKYRAWHKERKVLFPISEIDFRKSVSRECRKKALSSPVSTRRF